MNFIFHKTTSVSTFPRGPFILYNTPGNSGLEHKLCCIYYVNLGQTPGCYPFQLLASAHFNRNFKLFSGRGCSKGWAFTRVPQYEFVGTANEEVGGTQSFPNLKHFHNSSNHGLLGCQNLLPTQKCLGCPSLFQQHFIWISINFEFRYKTWNPSLPVENFASVRQIMFAGNF